MRYTVEIGKGGKDRYVPLPQPVLRMLCQYWATHRDPVWIFPSGHQTVKGPMDASGVQRAFQGALLDSGIQKPATVRTLRHSYATHLLENGLHLPDFGLQTLTPSAIQDLYEIIPERYEHGSILLTSNRAFEEWHDVFGNDLLASAALDRLTHHTHLIVITGESYRQRSRRKSEGPGEGLGAAIPGHRYEDYRTRARRAGNHDSH